MSVLYQRIKDLTVQNKMSLAELERRLDFSNGIISTWKTGNPSIDKVEKVANFFHVSTDYLLGRDQPNEGPATYFRINTEGLSDQQVADIKSELENYAKYLKQKAKGE